jgi:hypothetical protein
MCLTSCRHYIPICIAACVTEQLVMQQIHSADVRVGDLVLVVVGSADEAPQLSPVVEAWESAALGAFNPFVRGADLLVDGVVSSSAGRVDCSGTAR